MNKTKEKRYSNSILVLVAGILLLFFLCAGLVVYIDPFFQYHAPLKWFPYQIDNQISQNPGLAKNTDYDSVMLGSSMTINFDMGQFRELYGEETRKLSYSGAYPKDQANIMDIIFKSHPDLKRVYLGVDVITYTGDVEQTKYEIPTYLYDDIWVNDIGYVCNKDVIFQYILKPLMQRNPSNLDRIYESWWTNDYYGKERVLAGYELPQKNDVEADPEEYIKATKANLDQNLIPYIEQNKDTQFVLFFPPYSILFWNDVLVENHLEATLSVYRTIVEELDQYDNVKLFFFPSEEWIVTDLDKYADYSHYNPDINAYMATCFGSGDCLVNAQNIDETLDKMRSLALDYDFAECLSYNLPSGV